MDRSDGDGLCIRCDHDSRVRRAQKTLSADRTRSDGTFSADRRPYGFPSTGASGCAARPVPPVEPARVSGFPALPVDDTRSRDRAVVPRGTLAQLVSRGAGDIRPRVLLLDSHPGYSHRGACSLACARRNSPSTVVCLSAIYVCSCWNTAGDCRCSTWCSLLLLLPCTFHVDGLTG